MSTSFQKVIYLKDISNTVPGKIYQFGFQTPMHN